MSRILVASFAALLLAGVGCQGDKHDDGGTHKSSSSMKSSVDACSHCPGVQTANADGKCPDCGAKVK